MDIPVNKIPIRDMLGDLEIVRAGFCSVVQLEDSKYFKYCSNISCVNCIFYCEGSMDEFKKWLLENT